MSLNVTIPDTFDGPLGLLHYLIKREEIDIFDIPIAKLATAYLAEMRRMTNVDVDEAARFLDLASRLLEIKSRMLAPPEDLADGEEEEDEDFDPRAGLVEALLEYRRFKDAARLLGDLAEEQARRYPRLAPMPEFAPPPAGDGPTADSLDLMRAFQNLFFRLAPQNESNIITNNEVPTSVRIQQIETVLAETGRARFSLLLSGKPDRQEMVGFFIAILELIRQGRLVARQTENFSDIVLEPKRAPAAAAAAAGMGTRRIAAPRCFLPAPADGGNAARDRASPPPPCAFPRPAPSRRSGQNGTARRKGEAAIFNLRLCFRRR